MGNPEILCTQLKSQCQAYEKCICGDDPASYLIAQVKIRLFINNIYNTHMVIIINYVQTRCTYEQHNYCEENARLKMLLITLARKSKRRENDLRQLVLDLRKTNEKLIIDPC